MNNKTISRRNLQALDSDKDIRDFENELDIRNSLKEEFRVLAQKTGYFFE